MMPARKTQNWLPGIFNDFFGNEWVAKANTTAPAINIIENEKAYEVELAAPGLAKDDFKVEVDDNDQLVITVQNKKEDEEKDKKGRYLRREFSYSQFQQTMILPENVDKEQIKASQKDGVLTVVIPKKPVAAAKTPKQIEVK